MKIEYSILYEASTWLIYALRIYKGEDENLWNKESRKAKRLKYMKKQTYVFRELQHMTPTCCQHTDCILIFENKLVITELWWEKHGSREYSEEMFERKPPQWWTTISGRNFLRNI